MGTIGRSSFPGGVSTSSSKSAQTLLGSSSVLGSKRGAHPKDVPVNLVSVAPSEEELLVWEEERSRMVWFRRTAGLDPVAYLEGVAKVIRKADISTINTSDRAQIQIFTKSVESAKLLLSNGIRIGGDWYRAYRAEVKPLRIFVEDVPPCIPNHIIAQAFGSLGACLPGDVEHLKFGGNTPGFGRINTCRRVVWVEPNVDLPIPAEIMYSFAGMHFRSETRGSAPKCFKCGLVGHVRRACKSGGVVSLEAKVVSGVVNPKVGSPVAVVPRATRVNEELGVDVSTGNNLLTQTVRGLLEKLHGPFIGERNKPSSSRIGVTVPAGPEKPIASSLINKSRALKKARGRKNKNVGVEVPLCKKSRVEDLGIPTSEILSVEDMVVGPIEDTLALGGQSESGDAGDGSSTTTLADVDSVILALDPSEQVAEDGTGLVTSADQDVIPCQFPLEDMNEEEVRGLASGPLLLEDESGNVSHIVEVTPPHYN